MFFFSLWVAEILRLLSLIKHFYKSFNNVKHLKVRAKKRKKALKHDLHCPKWIFLLYLLFICSDSEPVWRHNLTRPLFVLCLYGCTGCLGCHRNVSEKHVTTCVCVFVRRSSQLWMTAAGYQSSSLQTAFDLWANLSVTIAAILNSGNIFIHVYLLLSLFCRMLPSSW